MAGDGIVRSAPDRYALVRSIARELRDHGEHWFPGLDVRRARTWVTQCETRPRCFLYHVTLDDGRQRHVIVAKVRHLVPEFRQLSRYDECPVLASVRTISDAEASRREMAGLMLLERVFAERGDDRFGVLRPLAWLEEQAAIVTPYTSDPTLRQVLVERRNPLDRVRIREEHLTPWRNAGAALRSYHEAAHDLELVDRQSTREELSELFERYAEFLAARTATAGSLLSRISCLATARIEDSLPDRMPLVLSHGDFVPRNLFVSESGRVTVFDPMPLWRTPMFEDLARITMVGLRLIDVQALSQGAFFASREVDEYERALLHGYFGEEAIPQAAILLYQLLLLLDKWCEMVNRDSRSGRNRLRAFRVRLAARHFEREARRLVTRLAGSC